MVVSAMVRRGVELASDAPPKQPVVETGGWMAGLFFFTVLVFLALLFSIEYTYGMVVPTLAAVEETNPEIYVRIDSDFDPNKPVDASDPDAEPPAAPKPVTSKLRSTIRHLRARGGFWSRFRGLSMAILCVLAPGLLSVILPFSTATSFIGQFFANMALSVLTANLQLAWVHIVISEPSSKRFYQRIPGWTAWKQIAPVAAFNSAVTLGAFYLPLLIMGGFRPVEEWGRFNSDVPAAYARFAASFSGPALLSALVSIPAQAIFVRVAASMLPEDDEAIVSFDRTFGGKVDPRIVGGSGRLGIKDAWRSFDRGARVRYVKAIGKAFAMELAVSAVFILALVGMAMGGAMTVKH